MQQLYNDEWKEWAKKGKQKKLISQPFETLHCVNRSCGDEVNFSICVEDNRIKDIGFDAKGCSICLGTTAFLSSRLIDLQVEDAISELQNIEEIVLKSELNAENSSLKLFELLADFPTRINCVLLETKNLLKFFRTL